MADAGCNGAGQSSFFRKNSITLGIKPHIVRYLQLTHTAGAIRQLRCRDCGRIASDKHLHTQQNWYCDTAKANAVIWGGGRGGGTAL
jgi:hypothetical protein